MDTRNLREKLRELKNILEQDEGPTYDYLKLKSFVEDVYKEFCRDIKKLLDSLTPKKGDFDYWFEVAKEVTNTQELSKQIYDEFLWEFERAFSRWKKSV